jgi:hypothetical protein
MPEKHPTNDSLRHVSTAAITAVRAVCEVDTDTALDAIEALRPHLDMPYVARIRQLEGRVRELERRLVLSLGARNMT